MFNLSDIRDIAIQIERNGENTYRCASRNATDPEVAHLLRSMAGEEKEHLQWFEKLEVAPLSGRGDPQVAEMGRELLQNIMDRQTFSLDEDRLAQAADIYDVLRQSREFENDTILFYEMLRDFLDDSITAKQLDRIIEEERAHIHQLEKMVAGLELDRQQTP